MKRLAFLFLALFFFSTSTLFAQNIQSRLTPYKLEVTSDSGSVFLDVKDLFGASKWGLSLFQQQDFTFLEGFNPRLTLQMGGNVGIGVTNPQSRLHLDGNIQLNSGGLPIGLTRLDVGNSQSVLSLDLNFNHPNALFPGAAGAFSIDERNNTDNPLFQWSTIVEESETLINGQDTFFISSIGPKRLMVLNGDGNLGIGTPTPTDKLTIAGSINFSDGVDPFFQGSIFNIDQIFGMDDIRFGGTFPNVDMILNAQGNLGIGGNPSANRLSVSGAADVTRLQTRLDSNETFFEVFDVGGNGDWDLSLYGQEDFVFNETNVAPRL